MSGAVAAHAAYNGSGTQGLAVTNKIQDQEGDVMSVFWNKNDTTRQLLHGSTILEVPASGNSGSPSFGGSKIFTINNDIDCLGELYLNMKIDIKNKFGSLGTGTVNVGVADAGKIVSVVVKTPGSGYNIGDVVTLNQAGAVGSAGGTVKVLTIDAGTGIATVEVLTIGSGHTGGDTTGTTVSPVGGTSAVFTITVSSASDQVQFDLAKPKFQFKLGALTNIIDRIEYQVGTQIWQTLEKDDVRVVYNTEMSEGAYDSVTRRGRPSNVGQLWDATLKADGTSTTFAEGDAVNVTFIIPALTKTLAPQLETFTNISESGYPLAAAPHQSVKIKIYFAPANDLSITIPAASVANGTFAPYEVKNSQYISSIEYTTMGLSGTLTSTTLPLGQAPLDLKHVKLYAKHIIMCNEERDQMKAMPLGLPKRLKLSQNALITDVSGVLQKTIDLDHFSIYGSHLIISGDLGKDVYVKSAELKLNSSSFSGVLPAQMLDYAAASSLGLYVNRSIEKDQTESLDGTGILVFPLGSTAYSGSSVPLNRFDSIRLTLTFTEPPPPGSPYINITCIGETTALFKGGAASLAMY
jgi:hypothetical protein